MTQNDIYVPIGKVKVGDHNNTLHALLGSCVGVAFLCPSKDIYGLAHCLLPQSPENSSGLDTRYVDLAISSLLKKMRINKKDYGCIQAVVAGGGNMTMPNTTDAEKLIGEANVKTALTCLKDLGIPIIHEDICGLEGRKIKLYCADNQFEIKSISRNLVS